MQQTREDFIRLAKIPGCWEELTNVSIAKRLATARERVLDFLVSYYSKIEPGPATDVYRAFLDGLSRELSHPLAQAPDVIRLFTLNYDEAVEAAIDRIGTFELCDGFTGFHKRSWVPSSFDAALQLQSDHTRVLLHKLHGSASWTRSKSDQTIEKTLYIERGQLGREHVLLYPTQREKQIDNEPFSVAYKALRTALSNASVGLFIGTSFRDKEISVEIKKRVETGKPFRLIAANPRISVETISTQTGVREKDIRIVSVSFEPSTIGQIMEEVRSSLAEVPTRMTNAE